MDEKEKDSILINREEFENYFREDLDAIEEELKKSKEYSEIIDKQIRTLTNDNYTSTKGGQHYLVEHIANAVQLQSQRQGLRKDRFSIKKAILDYAAKFANDENIDRESLAKKIDELIKSDKQQTTDQVIILNENIDNEIDKILEEDDSN